MELTISVIAYYIFGREIDLDAISGLRPHIESMTAGMVSLNVPFGKYFILSLMTFQANTVPISKRQCSLNKS